LATSARNRDEAAIERVAQVLRRLGKLYGNPPRTARIDTLCSSSKLDEFDWLLLIMSLEIDLKVHVPTRLIHPKRLTVAQFAAAIAVLPRVDSEAHTLETLQFLAAALLGEGESAPTRKVPKKRNR
jgi:hypothetical protein